MLRQLGQLVKLGPCQAGLGSVISRDTCKASAKTTTTIRRDALSCFSRIRTAPESPALEASNLPDFSRLSSSSLHELGHAWSERFEHHQPEQDCKTTYPDDGERCRIQTGECGFHRFLIRPGRRSCWRT